MDHVDPASNGKSKLVIGVVVVGVVVLGAGAIVAFNKSGGGGGAAEGSAADAEEVTRWCAVRTKWAGEVEPMKGDIMLKMAQDAKAAEALAIKRNMLCQQYAQKIQAMRVASERIKTVEVALIREGKVRANVSVEIANVLAQLSSLDTGALRRAQRTLEQRLKQRIAAGRAAAEKEVAAAMTAITTCKNIYRGPMTDEGTSDNPYISWDELDLRRTAAIRAFDNKIRELAPREQWTNLVHHKLVSHHHKELKACYRKYKKKKPSLSNEMGLRVRLKRNGKVASLGIEWMEVRAKGILDCLLKHAPKWTLPRPQKDGDYAVVKVDFLKI